MSEVDWEDVRRKPKLLMISGATAVGKSSVAIPLARELGGEILSVDSIACYEGLDIGSSKVLPSRRHGIPHHMISCYDPRQPVNLHIFIRDMQVAVDDVLARGRVPIMVGGSSQYLMSFLFPFPAANPARSREGQEMVAELLRRHSEGKEAMPNWDGVLDELHKVDPEYAASLSRNNWKRLRRALEIVLVTGKPLPRLETTTLNSLPWDVRAFFLWKPRDVLLADIDQRCEQMLVGGLLLEVIDLWRQGMFVPGGSPSSAIGYRQCLAYLAWLDRHSRAERAAHSRAFMGLIEQFQAGTRNFARRQNVWFRREPLFCPLPVQGVTPRHVVDVLRPLYHMDPEKFHGSLRGDESLFPPVPKADDRVKWHSKLTVYGERYNVLQEVQKTSNMLFRVKRALSPEDLAALPTFQQLVDGATEVATGPKGVSML